MYTKYFLYVTCLLCLLPVSAVGQQKPAGLTLNEALDYLLTHNRGARAAEAEATAARTLRYSAYELPKTELAVQYGQYSSIEKDNAWEVQQTLSLPLVWMAKRRLLQAEADTEQWRALGTKSQLRSQLRRSYDQMGYYRHKHRELQQLDSIYGAFAQIAEVRYAHGDIRGIDVSTAKTKRHEVKLMLAQNELDMQRIYAQTQWLLNRTDHFEMVTPEVYVPISLTLSLDSLSVGRNPALQEAYGVAKVAGHSKQAELMEALPELKLGYTNQSLIGHHMVNGREQFFDAHKRFQFVSVGVSIPLTFWASYARARAWQHKKQAADLRAADLRAHIDAQLQSLLGQYQHNMAQYHYYKQQALPNAQDMVAVAQHAYQAGEMSMMEYLFSLQTSMEIRFGFLECIQKLNETLIDIYELINL